MTTGISTRYFFLSSLLLLNYVSILSSAKIICSSCQGTAGSSCDVTPWETLHTTECNGKCITWRSIYATGRGLRTIWRGCEDTLIPTVLAESHRDACGYGNFFVECTRTCSSSLCNKNHTGLSRCWSCQGDHQSCDLSPPIKCEDPEITTTVKPPTTKIECIACQGEKGEMCDVAAFRSTDIVLCNETCVTRKTLLSSDRTLMTVWRGCTDTLFPGVLRPAALDSCDDVTDNRRVECTSTCSGHRCNKYSTGFTDCWTTEGRRKPSCATEAENTESEVFQTDLLDEIVTNEEQPIPEVQGNLPLGTLLNCTSCQGTAGSECDITSSQITDTVRCRGSCMTRRILTAAERMLRIIWRGCDQQLFPHVLDERFRNTCQSGNFFVECTDTCRTASKCNQNTTGIPRCWDCQGNLRNCSVEQEERCIDPVPATGEAPIRRIQCISCSSEEGGACDLRPHTEPEESCNGSCVTSKTFALPNRTVSIVWRGCSTELNVVSYLINSCRDSADNTRIECSTNCYDHLCNKYSPGIPTCWSEKAILRQECIGTTASIPDHLINPSRVSTKRPYQIQDAYGGDNYRGEWRPTSTDAPMVEENPVVDGPVVANVSMVDEENNSTTKWRRNFDNEGPYFGHFENAAPSHDITSLIEMMLISVMIAGYHYM